MIFFSIFSVVFSFAVIIAIIITIKVPLIQKTAFQRFLLFVLLAWYFKSISQNNEKNNENGIPLIFSPTLKVYVPFTQGDQLIDLQLIQRVKGLNDLYIVGESVRLIGDKGRKVVNKEKHAVIRFFPIHQSVSSGNCLPVLASA